MAKSMKRNVLAYKRPPRVVYILGHRIKIKIVKHLFDDDDNELAGAYDGETKTIFLAKSDNWKTVLWHEMIHCCLHLSGASEGLSSNAEERITLALEYGLGFLFF